jgi:hypothetical protein
MTVDSQPILGTAPTFAPICAIACAIPRHMSPARSATKGPPIYTIRLPRARSNVSVSPSQRRGCWQIQETGKSLAERCMNRMHLLSASKLNPRLRRGAGSASSVQYTRSEASRRTTAVKLFAFLYAVPSLLLCRCQRTFLGVRGGESIGTGNKARRMVGYVEQPARC